MKMTNNMRITLELVQFDDNLNPDTDSICEFCILNTDEPGCEVQDNPVLSCGTNGYWKLADKSKLH
jgi:hypothetical protein